MWRRAQWSGGYVSKSDSQSEGPWLSSATVPCVQKDFLGFVCVPYTR